MINKIIISILIFNCQFTFGKTDKKVIPSDFVEAIEVKLPISVARSPGIGGSFFVRGEDTGFDKIENFGYSLLHSTGNGIFQINGSMWASTLSDLNKCPGNYYSVSKLACRTGYECFIFSNSSVAWIIVSNKSIILSSQLVYATAGSRQKDGTRKRTGILDSSFGDGVLTGEYPIPKWLETGIFCSEYLNLEAQTSVTYKRRVTKKGKIENKIVNNWRDCEAPW